MGYGLWETSSTCQANINPLPPGGAGKDHNCGNEMKMNKWSSQWTKFMQLRKEAWKKFRTSTGFEPVTSRLPVRCSTNFAMKPLTLGRIKLSVYMFPWIASLRNCINCVHCDDHFFIFRILIVSNNRAVPWTGQGFHFPSYCCYYYYFRQLL